MAQFSKYKLGVTNLFTPTGVLDQNNKETGEANQFTPAALKESGVPDSELARHVELGNLVGLEGSKIEAAPVAPPVKK